MSDLGSMDSNHGRTLGPPNYEHNRFDAYDASATEKFWDHLFDTLTEEYENGNGAVCEFVNYDEEENEFEEDVH